MKGDRKRKQKVQEIYNLCQEFLAYPNQCAYTDSILDAIVKIAKEIPEIDKEFNNKGIE